MFISTNVPEAYDVLRLTPVKEIKNVTVVKYVPPATQWRSITRETALVQVTDPKSGFTSTFIYPKSEELPPFQLLADKDVTYEVSIFMTDEDKLVGGYKGNWTVAWDDLKYADSIEFSLVEFLRTATDDEIAANYMNIENLSMQVPQPKLKVVLP
jgi:hypothetical protein